MMLEHLHETGPSIPAVTAEGPDKRVISVNTRGEPSQVNPAKTVDPQNCEQLCDYCSGTGCYATNTNRYNWDLKIRSYTNERSAESVYK